MRSRLNTAEKGNCLPGPGATGKGSQGAASACTPTSSRQVYPGLLKPPRGQSAWEMEGPRVCSMPEEGELCSKAELCSSFPGIPC